MSSGRVRPHKRQRTLSSSTSPSSKSNFNISTSPTTLSAPFTCSCCHRLLTTLHVQLLLCLRCSAPTCAICSRTCSARVPSHPPTPHLTWSPSPSPILSPCHPLRELDPEPEKLTAHVTGKRRKQADDEQSEAKPEVNNDNIDEYGIGPGCGRAVCRNCCIENAQSNTISCYDCYGH